jgi:hypothetical protein
MPPSFLLRLLTEEDEHLEQTGQGLGEANSDGPRLHLFNYTTPKCKPQRNNNFKRWFFYTQLLTKPLSSSPFLMQTAFFLTAKEPEFQKAFFYCSVSFTFREYASKALGGNEPKSFESNYDFDTEVVQHFLAKQDST